MNPDLTLGRLAVAIAEAVELRNSADPDAPPWEAELRIRCLEQLVADYVRSGEALDVDNRARDRDVDWPVRIVADIGTRLSRDRVPCRS